MGLLTKDHFGSDFGILKPFASHGLVRVEDKDGFELRLGAANYRHCGLSSSIPASRDLFSNSLLGEKMHFVLRDDNNFRTVLKERYSSTSGLIQKCSFYSIWARPGKRRISSPAVGVK